MGPGRRPRRLVDLAAATDAHRSRNRATQRRIDLIGDGIPAGTMRRVYRSRTDKKSSRLRRDWRGVRHRPALISDRRRLSGPGDRLAAHDRTLYRSPPDYAARPDVSAGDSPLSKPRPGSILDNGPNGRSKQKWHGWGSPNARFCVGVPVQPMPHRQMPMPLRPQGIRFAGTSYRIYSVPGKWLCRWMAQAPLVACALPASPR